jgi:periplasmic divalent cation tolerance protein
MIFEAEHIMVYVTVPNEKMAERLANLAISKGLAACANLLSPIRSWYQWEGALQTAEEAVLLLKTRASLFEPLRTALAEAHPYDCPCIIALPLSGGHLPFLEWISAQTLSKPNDA